VVQERQGVGAGLVVGAIGGTALGVALASLLAARPAEAAPPEDKLNYLIELLTAVVPVLAEVAESNASLAAAIQQWLAAQGIEPGVGVQWAARDPEQIYSHAIRAPGTFYSDKMVDWTRGKRILFKVESTLNQAAQIQLIGNKDDNKDLATDVGAALPCAANGNISVGPAWDDWHPFMGVRITVAVAPTAGILNIWQVLQE